MLMKCLPAGADCCNPTSDCSRPLLVLHVVARHNGQLSGCDPVSVRRGSAHGSCYLTRHVGMATVKPIARWGHGRCEAVIRDSQDGPEKLPPVVSMATLLSLLSSLYTSHSGSVDGAEPGTGQRPRGGRLDGVRGQDIPPSEAGD